MPFAILYLEARMTKAPRPCERQAGFEITARRPSHGRDKLRSRATMLPTTSRWHNTTTEELKNEVERSEATGQCYVIVECTWDHLGGSASLVSSHAIPVEN